MNFPRERLMLLALPLLLAGCSMVQVFYEQLDTFARYEASRWFDLDRDQVRRFRERVAVRLDIHRREELPRYARVLEQYARFVERGVAPAELVSSFAAIDEELRVGLALSAPVLAATLAELEPAQVDRFARELEESNEEYRNEYLEVSAERRRDERIEAAIDGIERWSGRLDPEQRSVLEEMVDAIPDDAALWYDRRLLWQQGVLERLRKGADVEAHTTYLEDWWLHDTYADAAHEAQLARDREVFAVAIADLVDGLSDAQRTRAAGRLRDMATELRSLVDGSVAAGEHDTAVQGPPVNSADEGD